MEHLNNEMDDLFSKAGELYPLKTTELDWDAVLGKLQEINSGDQTAISGLNAKTGRNKRRWLLLLLLIPIGLGSALYFSSDKKTQEIKPTARPEISRSSKQTDALNKKAMANDQSQTDLQSADKQMQSRDGHHAATDQSTKKRTDQVAGAKNKTVYSGVSVNNNINKSSVNELNPNTASSNGIQSGIESKSIAAAGILGEQKEKTTSSEISNENKSALIPDSLSKAETPKDTLTNKEISKKTDAKTNSYKGIYISLLVGPDLSTVKFQSVKQPGFSAGLIIGYRFNKHLSIESGLFWDKKYYYTKGQYFNTSKLPVQPPPQINNLEGYCNMFEIPLNLRYDFASVKNHGFFLKMGLSSYLMKKEDYSFELYNGWNNITVGPYLYYNTSNTIFSVIQISGGYETAIGKKTKIQIEPYLKIPLQGIGIGDLPISSAGIYFGITHSFR